MPTPKHYRSLMELIDRITDSHDLDTVLSQVLDTLAGHFATARALILLPDHRGLLRVASARGMDGTALAGLPTLTLDPADTARLADFQGRHGLPLLQVIELQNRPRGLVLLGRRGDGADYGEEDLDYIATVADMGALAVEYQQLIRRLNASVHDLDSKVSQLSSLFELSKEFSGTLDPEVIGQLLVFTLVQQFRVEGFAVVGLRQSPPRIIEARLPRQALQAALADGALAHLTAPLHTAAVAGQHPALAALGVTLIVPVNAFGRISGAILLGQRRDGAGFSNADVDYVAAVGSLAIISAENARLFQTALEKERMEQDLAVARTIQQKLLPRELPDPPGFELAAYNRPAYQVGGDYYDVFDLGAAGLVLAIADVAGKGVHSALMANLQAFLEALCQQPPPLGEATARLNAYVAEHAPPEMFVTFFWGVLDTRERRFRYVNAGHNPPLLLRDGEPHWLDTDGLVLGALNPAPPFTVGDLELRGGDIVVAYTDGITEAHDICGELFGEARLVAAVQEAGNCPADSLLASLTDAVARFCGDAETADDITCLVVRVL